jgi:hypothetical protein
MLLFNINDSVQPQFGSSSGTLTTIATPARHAARRVHSQVDGHMPLQLLCGVPQAGP